MAKTFTSWTVLPHDPIEKYAPNLWRVSGTMPDPKIQRQMMCARMNNGDVIVHNAIALEDKAMAELEAWGTPAIIFVPSGFHRQDALIWKQRYPKARVMSPPAAKKRVSSVVAVDAITGDGGVDDNVKLVALDGLPGESLLQVHTDSGVTLVFGDAVCNFPKLKFPMSVLLGPTGRVSAPWVIRLIGVKDKKALASQLEKLADLPKLERLCVGHGKPVTDDAPGALRTVVAQLRA